MNTFLYKFDEVHTRGCSEAPVGVQCTPSHPVATALYTYLYTQVEFNGEHGFEID